MSSPGGKERQKDWVVFSGPRSLSQPGWLRLLFWIVAVVLGGIQCWAYRFAFDPDGIAYLDMGDAYFRADWKTAVNACWSPLYGWLLALGERILRPSPEQESSVVQVVNFVVYLVALLCFEFFLRALTEYRRRQLAATSAQGRTAFPDWAWQSLGYILFLWSCLNVNGVSEIHPDMCMSWFVYLAAGLILQAHMRLGSPMKFLLLGFALGFGYLAKAPMFPLAFVFLGVCFFAVADRRQATAGVLIGIAGFLLVAGPFVVALSRAKGRWTFGDNGSLNYAFVVNGAPNAHWRGEPPGTGHPKHPTRRLSQMPPVYEYATPLEVTYPPWYDPSYWNEGIKPHFSFSVQLRALARSVRSYYDLLLRSQGWLIAGILIIFLSDARKSESLRNLWRSWPVLIPALIALGMYAFVMVLPRCVAVFLLIFFMGLLAGLGLPDSAQARKLLVAVAITVVGLTGIAFLEGARDALKQGLTSTNTQWEIAQGLREFGLQPGDKVAVIGEPFYDYWARWGRLRIIAEVPDKEPHRFPSPDPPPGQNKFWALGPPAQTAVIEILRKTGARAIVADGMPLSASAGGWQRVGRTDRYVFFLSP
jgi:hypothetical protein